MIEMDVLRSVERLNNMTEIKSNLKTAICWEAEKYFAANKAKNKASREERKAQEELDILLAQDLDGEYGKIEHTFSLEQLPPKTLISKPLDGMGVTHRKVTVEIIYQQDIKDVIDIKKLYGKVDMDTFINIVTASNAAVVREAGKNIAAQCTGSKVGEYKVKVKEKK